jgi:hypothetical protein
MDTIPKALVASAIILAGAIIVAADFLKSSYQIAGVGNARGVYRLNESTGELTLCQITSDEAEAGVDHPIAISAHCDVAGRK